VLTCADADALPQELEHLLEKGVVNDTVFDDIMRILPTESSLSSAATPASRQAAVASPPPAPTNAMANLALNQNPSPSPAPPSYNSTGPPSLPVRNNGPPAPPPTKPVIANARALYKYTAADDRDLSFERDDRVQVFEYMNDDWWMGRNVRTGAEGIFPKNYVEIDYAAPPPGGFANEKAGFYAPPPGAGAGAGGNLPPPQQNPYNANVPPMAVAEGSGGQAAQQNGEGGGKAGQMGKKFGKKLGNAAIFGAGATLGGNLVNSIF
jgi:LAS seventeen-binding protein 1/2